MDTLPASAYVDAGTYERERTAVFARQWQLAGFRAHLREPGDVATHTFAGWNVLVVVQDDGSLRAFHNVCRHRAGPVVDADHGHCSTLVCRYHGWVYERDGTLKSARDFGDDTLDPAAFGLLPVAVDEWRGLVFVNLAGEHAPPLTVDLGAFFAEADGQPIEDFSYSHRLLHDVAANWKVYGDNYMEGYHIPLVHPGLNKEINAKQYRVDVRDRCCVHSAPARDGAINSGKWLWRYPNLALNFYADGMNVERFVPAGPRRTQVIYDYFFRDLDARAENEAVAQMGCAVLDEDRTICEAVQRNLESGIYDTGRLSPRHENGVRAFQQWVRESLTAP
jgi:choline monooxygenase